MKNVNVQVNLFNQGLRDWEMIIDDNIDGIDFNSLREWEMIIDDIIDDIDFDSLTMDQYILIVNSMKFVCDIINSVIKQQEK